MVLAEYLAYPKPWPRAKPVSLPRNHNILLPLTWMAPTSQPQDLMLFHMQPHHGVIRLTKKNPTLGATPTPILVIQAGNDSFILPHVTANAVERSCASGNEVALSVYAETEHSSVIPASVLEWLPWFNQLFDRDQSSTQTKHLCSRAVREPFDHIHLKAPPEVNF